MLRVIAIFLAGTIGGNLFAQSSGQDYRPPSSPELYDTSKPVQPAYEKYPPLLNHPYVGLGLGFGQSDKTGRGGSPIAAWNVSAEAGYVKTLGTWSQIDAGVEVLGGRFGYSRADVSMTWGALAKLGYGYTISPSGGVIGQVRLAAGLGQGNLSGEDSSGVSLESAQDFTITMYQLGFQIILPANASLDVIGGLLVTQNAFTLRDIEQQGDTTRISDGQVYNVIEARIGLRLRL